MFRYLAPAGNTIMLRDTAKAFIDMFKPDIPQCFAQKLKTLVGVKHCFLVSSGTLALYLALISLRKLVNKKEVILPAYTCPAVLAAVIRAGLKPVLCDLDNNTSNMNLVELAGKISGDTLAVITVHLFGIRENTAEINEIVSAHNIFHIEDAAQLLCSPTAHGQEIPRPACTPEIAGTMKIISFGRGKPLTLLQGGAITTDSDTIAESVRGSLFDLERQGILDTAVLILKTVLYALLFHPRLYWIAQRSPFLQLGKTIFNLDFAMKCINPFTCALGNIMIDHIMGITMIRRQKENLLYQQLSPASNHLLAGGQDDNALLRFPLLMDNKGQRDRVLSLLKRAGLGATSMYEAPLHLFKDTQQYFPGNNNDFTNAQSFSERILTLPLHTFMKARDMLAVRTIINHSIDRDN